MTAPESTNAHGDAHRAALDRSRKRAALRAWNEAVKAQRLVDDAGAELYALASIKWHDAAEAAFGRSIVTGPASVGKGW